MTRDANNPQVQSQSNDGPARATRRLGHVAVAFVMAIAVVGFFVGLHDGVTPHRPTQPPAGSEATAMQALDAISYAQIPGTALGPNRHWRSELPRQTGDPERLLASVELDEAMRQAALEQREQRRAFNGAPPVIPHAIDQQAVASCLACHGNGMRVGDVVAPIMSHETLPNCTQCHVESTNRSLPPRSGLRVGANRFAGQAAPGPGERAWPGAPPIVPHTTWMRENCMSCHGTLAQQGLRTTHPWRTSCLQCHAPSAALDQTPISSPASTAFSFPQERDHE
ncbi:MAG: nitrate reductase cytochrome c-type subunit [Rhodospirillales bacterium]|nr:nitrate reductase cytochrome c-type subunit [Rhodospirillales bacterium]